MINKLISQARAAAEHAYAPYSGIKIGAAALFSDEKLYVGCNVENGSYGLTICAERNAIANGISYGSRDLVAVGIFVDGSEVLTPCGACRQVIYEFGVDTRVIATCGEGETIDLMIGELLPKAFSLRHP